VSGRQTGRAFASSNERNLAALEMLKSSLSYRVLEGQL
jgi:hypothetical protein